jgi:hypothetical protein
MLALGPDLVPGKRSGQPCIRGLRITVWDVLGWLAAGKMEAQIIEDYPELEKDDFRAPSLWPARMAASSRLRIASEGSCIGSRTLYAWRS